MRFGDEEQRFLEVVGGPLSGRSVPLTQDLVVGRGVEADVCLPDAKMSRLHARLRWKRANLIIEDAGSHNGVIVNEKLVRRARLVLGDRVRLGGTLFVVVDRPPEASERPEVRSKPVADVLSLADFAPLTLERMPTEELLAAIGAPATGEHLPHEDIDADSLRTVWRNFAVVYNVSRALERSRSQADLLNAATTLIFKVIDADRCYILLVDGESGQLEPRLARSRDQTSEEIPVALSRSLLERVLRERTAIVSGDALEDGDLGRRASIRELQLRSVMCVPIVQDGEVTGVIQLQRERPNAFSRKDLELVTIVASLLGLKVQNVTLVEQQAQTIRQLRQLQEELVAKERLAVLGGLASGLTHEVRNLLTPLPVAEHVLATYTDDPELLELGELLGEASKRIGTLLKEVRGLALGEKSTLELTMRNLGETLSEATRFARLGDPVRSHEVRIEVEPSLRPFRYDDGRIKQALLNLLRNAAQSMDAPGEIVVTARPNGEAAGVLVEVADTGRGMSEDELARIFEPFFTTKAGGLGLGLQIARTIVERHGGRMVARSHLGQGTTVGFTLPFMPLVQPPTMPKT